MRLSARPWTESSQVGSRCTKDFGYAAHEVIGKPVTILIPRELWREEAEILKRLRGVERIEHYETTHLCKDGRSIIVALTISPIRDPPHARDSVRLQSQLHRRVPLRIRLARHPESAEDRAPLSIFTSVPVLDCAILLIADFRILSLNRCRC